MTAGHATALFLLGSVATGLLVTIAMYLAVMARLLTAQNDALQRIAQALLLARDAMDHGTQRDKESSR